MSRIVTEMGHGGTMTAMTEEEIATGIVMTTGTAETSIEEVCYSACLEPGFRLGSTRSLFGTNLHLGHRDQIFDSSKLISQNDEYLSFAPLLLGFDSRGGGGGRRAFGSGFRRDYDDSRGSSDRYGDRDRYGEREDRFERRDERREERGESSIYKHYLVIGYIWQLIW